VKPNSCIMPIPFGLCVQTDRLGHRALQDEMSRSGFCISNAEIRRFKFSLMSTSNELQTVNKPSDTFTQFVADNFDHNVRTLDGLGTFHGMGIIAATVCRGGSFGLRDRRIMRCAEMPASAAVQNKCVPLLQFRPTVTSGLDTCVLCPFNELRRPLIQPDIINLCSVWHVGVLTGLAAPRPSWLGFMQSVCRGENCNPCEIQFLSLIDRNPADYDCIYSTLQFVSDQARSLDLPVACITFDQPLYIKAVDICLKSRLSVVVKLGGFHTLMNYLGAVGHVMRGTGFEEVLLLLFGQSTIEHVLSGKAYARAIRGHFLVQAALVQMLLEYLSTPADTYESNISTGSDAIQCLGGCLSQACLSELAALYDHVASNGVAVAEEMPPCESLVVVEQKLDLLKSTLRDHCRTARLWIAYIEYVDIIRQFLIAERTSNWLLHLDVVQRMLPVFAVTGHINYARSARLYVQQMRHLPDTQPWLHEQFMSGNHTIRRSNRFWAGLSPDLCIEQTLMCAGKSHGGLTHGRGMTETVRTTWLSTLADCSGIHTAMVQLSGTEKVSAEHVGVTAPRMTRDRQDMDKIKKYLHTYSPFRYNDNSRLISLESGVATSSSDKVNCDIAQSLGYVSQQRWDSNSFGTAKIPKGDKIQTMTVLTRKSSDPNVRVTIDPHTLFHRLILVAERQQSIRTCFGYELTPYPMALFKDSVMRKADKPALLRDTLKDLCTETLPSKVQFVVDGGYLLHKVRWCPPANMSTIQSAYVSYLHKFGSAPFVVFDGYESCASIKDHEHQRRSGLVTSVAPARNLTDDSTQIGAQEPFLANVCNKKALINLLKGCFARTDIKVSQAVGDADTEIVSVALRLASAATDPVAVVAEDTDIIVLLLYHWQSTMSDVFVYSEGNSNRGQKNVAGKCISIRAVQHKISTDICHMLPAVHAFGGCDSTSAVFGHGKGTLLKLVQRNSALHECCFTLKSPVATVAEVKAAGVKMFTAVYGGQANESLAELRYSAYCSKTLCARFKPETLAPSEGAASVHALRAHYQAVVWVSLGQTQLDPTDWGWKLESNALVPVQLIGEVAPSDLLKIIKCSCKTQCTRASCSCRTYGLHCVSACKACRGTNCSNCGSEIPEIVQKESEEDSCSHFGCEGLPDMMDDEELYFYDEEVV